MPILTDISRGHQILSRRLLVLSLAPLHRLVGYWPPKREGVVEPLAMDQRLGFRQSSRANERARRTLRLEKSRGFVERGMVADCRQRLQPPQRRVIRPFAAGRGGNG